MRMVARAPTAEVASLKREPAARTAALCQCWAAPGAADEGYVPSAVALDATEPASEVSESIALPTVRRGGELGCTGESGQGMWRLTVALLDGCCRAGGEEGAYRQGGGEEHGEAGEHGAGRWLAGGRGVERTDVCWEEGTLLTLYILRRHKNTHESRYGAQG